ncbi:hypothetical protein SCP_0803980 [Sparassis crispa]|uniref:Fungal-type protein kinase domain-containing protein n=1 Tax=Sparassis crispa TaxID=139825 RepID=A0A401GUK2_9APHY|nr:hypothetical protein SCP_0803980 [Sparassis crispa]GBE85876.1 hypothetical protein SCP_0803980 [Sparassis crispa]
MLILHRNVGVHSIMCEIRSDSVHAILTDFSRACHVSKTGEPLGIHEGWPSPSQDRLQSLEAQQSVVEEQSNPFHPDLSWVPGDVPHLLLYDYEGLLYTAVWCTCLPRRLRWRDRNFFPWYIIIHDVSDGRPFAERHHPLPEFRGYTKWMTAFWGLFCNARKAVNIMGRSASMHDQETAYGILTAEAIKEKLQAVPLCEEVGESKSDLLESSAQISGAPEIGERPRADKPTPGPHMYLS